MGITENNLKAIRSPFSVFAGISARIRSNLTFIVNGACLIDDNYNSSLDHEHWQRRELADLNGFPVDGSREWYKPQTATEDGKIGAISELGGTLEIKVMSGKEIPAITIGQVGAEEVTSKGRTYTPGEVVVIPCNAKEVTVELKAPSDGRVVVFDIVPGIVVDFDNESITSCKLSLRSDLNITGYTLPISEIELKAHWLDDISEAIANVSNNTPIYYYSGIDGDYSRVRHFYLSEAVSYKDGVLTIKGEDAAGRLDDETLQTSVMNSNANNGQRQIYNSMVKHLRKAGVTLRKKEKAPAVGTAKNPTKYTIIQKGTTRRDIIADYMALAHKGTFWPVFVDAGIPELRWTKPTAKWTIYEDDCGEIKDTIDRNIAKIKSENEGGLQSTVTRGKKWVKLAEKKVKKKGEIFNINPSGYHWCYTVSNASIISQTCEKVSFKAKNKTTKKKVKVKKKDKKTGKTVTRTKTKYLNQCVLKGKKAKVSVKNKSLVDPDRRSGITVTVTPIVHGKFYQGTSLVYPNYPGVFNRSNLGGEFKWKGDPRMQPRDVFKFVRLDGTTKTCTISEIDLEHEGGGTIATIKYRNGVV